KPNSVSGETTKRRAHRLGQWDWYATAIRVEPGFSAPDWGVVHQFNYPTLSSPPAAIGLVDNNGILSFRLDRNAGLLTDKGNGWYGGTVVEGQWLIPAPIGKWAEFVIGIKWTTDATGSIRVYTRVKDNGEAGFTLRLTRDNTPTWQY